MNDKMKSMIQTATVVLFVFAITIVSFIGTEFLFLMYGPMAVLTAIIFVPLTIVTLLLVYLLYDITLWQIKMKKDDK